MKRNRDLKRGIILSALMLLVLSSLALGADDSAKMKTIENLKAAFTGETTASAKYAAYALKAKEEGLIRVSLLFEAASKAEGIHAANHAAVLDQLGEKIPEVTPKFEVKSTLENLQDALNGETYEVTTMYPEFLKASAESKINIATISLNYAYQTEQNHQALYAKALDAVKQGGESTLATQYLVCTTCGNTYETSSPKRCAICMTSKDRFITVI